MKVLIVDDDKNLTSFLKKALEPECFEVDVANDGSKGLFLARTNEYDLIILDFSMPEKNGDEVCKSIREDGINTPVIILSVESEPQKKANLLNIGADDFLSKPFSLEELLARIKAVLRRPGNISANLIKIDDMVIDPKKHLVVRGKDKIKLTLKEFMLLEYMAKHIGEVLSRAKILEHVWDMNADPFSNTIEAHISNLRKKINTKGKTELIHTISGRGYKLDVEK